MPKPPSISGFTLVRNAQILDYPFRESVLSLLPLCDEFIINCGKSDDGTLELCQELQRNFPEKIKILETVWNENNQSGGFQLKAQTDRALKECRGDWCFYLQADELIHEEDRDKIRAAIQKAEAKENVDGILFEYVHFYGNFTWAIRGRNWYRREVRCFKNRRGIEAFRDAQGFRKGGARLLVLPSGARVFHYGYVRSSESFKKKSVEMSKWWGEKPPTHEKNFTLVNHIGLYRFDGTHPALLHARVLENAHYFDPKSSPRKWDKREIKNLLTLVWERVFRFRIGEFRNYETLKHSP